MSDPVKPWTPERLAALGRLWESADQPQRRSARALSSAPLAAEDLYRAMAALDAPMRYPHNPVSGPR